MELFTGWPLFVAGLFSLVSGLVLGLGAVYCPLRYWSLVVKLALVIVLVTLVQLAE